MPRFRCQLSAICFLVLAMCISCRKRHPHSIAFYYWKTDFQLSADQRQLLNQSNANHLYIRFFDVRWDSVTHRAFPNAVVSFNQRLDVRVTPVLYITNKTFEKIADADIDSLAIKCHTLVKNLASGNNIHYSSIQIDCDWTPTSRGKYFAFLTQLKTISKDSVEATIRLHQVKYRKLTGVPPVNRGVLMFYNMGKLNANPRQANSIYNYADAEKYLTNLGSYPLPLDIALPAFSWAIQIRNGRVIQVYEKITPQLLQGGSFQKIKGTNCYVATSSFFWGGVYIKQSDIFKLEEAGRESLLQAAQQLSKKLTAQTDRTLIFYELANINPDRLDANTIKEVSADF